MQNMLNSVRRYLSFFEEIGEREDKILETMKKINREYFVPENLRALAYLDEVLPIGNEQTISQPSTVARMLQILELKKGEDVLEIGTGSGWNVGLIAEIVKPGKVMGYEIIEELYKNAKENLKKFDFGNLEIKIGDFRDEKRKFDRIIFTAGIEFEQEDFIEGYAKEHLRNNGILVCPYRKGPLMILKNKDGKIRRDFTQEEYVFVPLVL